MRAEVLGRPASEYAADGLPGGQYSMPSRRHVTTLWGQYTRMDLGWFVQLQRRVYLFSSNTRWSADIPSPVAPCLRFLWTGCKEAIITWQV